MSLTNEALSIFLNQPNYVVVKPHGEVPNLSIFKDSRFIFLGEVKESQLKDFDLKSWGIIENEEFFSLLKDKQGKPIRNKAMLKHFNKLAKRAERDEKKELKQGAYSLLIKEAVKFPSTHDILFVAAGSSQKERDSYLDRLVANTAAFKNGKIRFSDDWYAIPFIDVKINIGLNYSAEVHYALKHKKLLGKKAIRVASYRELLELVSKYHLAILDKPAEDKKSGSKKVQEYALAS